MSSRQRVELPVVEVTVLEDRARVRRSGTAELAAGFTAVEVAGVSPVIVDKTLQATSDRGSVADVRIDRSSVQRIDDQDEALRALEGEIEATEDAVSRMRRRLERVMIALEQLADAGAQTIADIQLDASWSRIDREAWDASLDGLHEREKHLRDERLGARLELDERIRLLARLRARRASLVSPSDAVRATLLLDVDIDAAGACTITVDYLVPNACWRPYHRAVREADAIRFASDGCVWQNTGEDWVDVRLRFSTQRPSLGAEPPPLGEDVLRAKKRREAIVVETRSQTVETGSLKGGGASAPEVPGIDDGGEALELEASDPVSILSDGRPHRVPLFEFETRMDLDRYAVAELVAAVLVRTRQENAAPYPILAGPVDLIVDGGHVGRTSVLYIGPRERFELGWGPDPDLRVHRVRERRAPEANLLRNWTRVEHLVTLKLSNLGDEKKQITLTERVPVSEVEKVQIEVDASRTTGGVTPDENGFLRWPKTLAAFARVEIELRYSVRQHRDVEGG